ncbi:hypothetical protein VNO77_34427 [Canavalia gladiata]|uniref:Uncharacterized protein n=1 Tax=Canavalia gladiata TaxID=3824 RepID=A0AAN9PYI7_CANGL
MGAQVGGLALIEQDWAHLPLAIMAQFPPRAASGATKPHVQLNLQRPLSILRHAFKDTRVACEVHGSLYSPIFYHGVTSHEATVSGAEVCPDDHPMSEPYRVDDDGKIVIEEYLRWRGHSDFSTNSDVPTTKLHTYVKPPLVETSASGTKQSSRAPKAVTSCSFQAELAEAAKSSYAGLEESLPPVSNVEAVAEAYAKRFVEYDRNAYETNPSTGTYALNWTLLLTALIVLLWNLPSPYDKEHFMIFFHGSGATRSVHSELRLEEAESLIPSTSRATIERYETRSSRKQFPISGVAPPLCHIAGLFRHHLKAEAHPCISTMELSGLRQIGVRRCGFASSVVAASFGGYSSPAYALMDGASSALESSGQVRDGLVHAKDEEAPHRPWISRGRKALL